VPEPQTFPYPEQWYTNTQKKWLKRWRQVNLGHPMDH